MAQLNSSIDPQGVKFHGGGRQLEVDRFPLESIQTCDIEDVQAASEAEGWMVEYHQIQAGRLSPRIAVSRFADVSLREVQVDRRIEFVGKSPSTHVSIFALVKGANQWINGLTLDTRNILLVEPGAEIHAVTGEDTHTISMCISIDRLREIRCDILEPGGSHGRGRVISVNLGQRVAQILMQLMYAGIHKPVSSSKKMKIAANMATIVSALVEGRIGYPKNTPRIMIDESLRTIKCAREIIETNLSETIPIGDICKNCAVSCSKLERIFRRELAMTPTQYILVRRLEAVNRVLAKPLSTHDSIGRIAMDFGFNHLGRFAGAYRSHFGELPSQTVRSS